MKCDEFLNLAVNGISYSSLTNVLPEKALAKTVQGYGNADIIIVSLGTNDYGTNVPLGRFGDENDVSFYGAIDYVYKKLKKENSKSRIIIITPIPRADDGKRESGYSLEDYRKAIKQVATKYGLEVICGEKMKIDPKKERDRNKYIIDGVHINNAGHVLYYETVKEQLKLL